MYISFLPHRIAVSLAMFAAAGGAAHAQSPSFWQKESIWTGPSTFSKAPSLTYVSPDNSVRAEAGLGVIYLRADEKVLVGNYTLSHLIWQSTAPVLRGSVDAEFGHGFSVRAEGSMAFWGRSYMEDYDWTKGDDTFANWSHRSQHPDTRLDHYFTGAVSLGYALVKDETSVVRAHGGFKYTDTQWTAYGGSFVYSDPGFRDKIGTFADGAAAATYRQQFPELFLGLDGERNYGNFRIGGLLRGGLTFLSISTDDHWMRNLRFVDALYVAPTITAGVDVALPLGDNAELSLAARYDHIFEQRGNTEYFNIATGAPTGAIGDVAGGGLRSAEVTAGLKGSF
jgi:omptin